MEIEYALVNQLCHFEDFPARLLEQLNKENLLMPMEIPFRCPVTMEPLSFVKLKQEVEDPLHGKSNFQVGHMNPLKAVNDETSTGHTAKNISWISSDGNRIQGHLSLDVTRALIRSIAQNYERLGVDFDERAADRIEEIRTEVEGDQAEES